MVKVRKHGEVLTVLFNILKSIAAGVVNASGLGKESWRVKAEMIPYGQNPPRRLIGDYGTERNTLEDRKRQSNARSLQELTAV
jgi:hypothetical protein